MPVMVLGLPALGYLLGGLYLPLQETWLPAGTPAQRWKLSICALGVICLLVSLASGWVRQAMQEALPPPYTFLTVFSFSMLLFAGATPRLHQQRLFPTASRSLGPKALLPPALLCVLLWLSLRALRGNILFL